VTELALFSDPRMLDHDPGAGHPEHPGRLAAILRHLREHPVRGARLLPARSATAEEIARVHLAGYLSVLEGCRGEYAELDPDTRTSPGSVLAAELSAGAAIQAMEHALEVGPAFALCRPPGHHAERGRGMGFCLVNNIAVAAEAALLDDRVGRVLILDWDVHHGNGTQHHFEDRGEVLFVSAHRYPWYPHTGRLEERGRGEGEGTTLNLPLPAGCGDGDYGELFREVLVPEAERFRPDLVLVSAGFDAHRRDQMGGMALTDEGFAGLCGIAKDLADRLCQGRIALILEGGYDLRGLAGSARACMSVLAGETAPELGRAQLASELLREAAAAIRAGLRAPRRRPGPG
jgi:acetoin utilization deacetylase AcuC-like enzyme